MSWQSTAVAVTAPVLGFGAAYLTLRRSRSVDRITQQSGAVTESRAGTAQIIDGLNQLIDQLQDDNQSFRDDIKGCALRLETITKERDDLRRELNRLHRRYGNGDTPPGGTPTTNKETP